MTSGDDKNRVQPVRVDAQALLQCEVADWLFTPPGPSQTAEHSSMRELRAGDYGEELCIVCDMARDEWWRSRASASGSERQTGSSCLQKQKGRSDKGFTGQASRR